jgi:hypothetical protein
VILHLLLPFFFIFQNSNSPVARVHYDGGGDWYGNKTSFKNIFRLYEKQFKTKLPLKEETVRLDEEALFNYPVLYISGHGNVTFSDYEVEQLRVYLQSGGFLFIDDDFGIDKSIRREMKKVLPKSEFIELPFSHEIFSYPFKFPSGLPKIHEHAGGAPKAYGLFYKKRMVSFYSFNTDISDGCEDKSIHNDSDDVRLAALRMGTNILAFAINN